jgi:four helix bundle protein
MPIQTYRELIVWQKAIRAIVAVYKLAKLLPAEEKYGLKSQIQRASVSIAANIAEGYGRSHRGDYLRFLSISKGSLCEVETYLVLFKELEFFSDEEIRESWDILQEVGKMLTSMISSLSPTP